jgi:hypothetical protein
MIAIAASLVTAHLVSSRPYISGVFSSGRPSDEPHIRSRMIWLDLCPIALLAFGAAGQVTLSRVLGLIELPTTVLSTLFHDFTADLYNLKWAWDKSMSVKGFFLVKERRQLTRLNSIVALFLGGYVGGRMYKSPIGMAGALWFAVGIKFFISVAFLLWKKETAVSEQEQTEPPQRGGPETLPKREGQSAGPI